MGFAGRSTHPTRLGLVFLGKVGSDLQNAEKNRLKIRKTGFLTPVNAILLGALVLGETLLPGASSAWR